MIKLTLGCWLTAAIVLVSGLGCASSPETGAPIASAADSQTIIAIAQPSTRPIKIYQSKAAATTQPVAQKTVRAKVAPKPVIAKAKPAPDPKPLPETWDGQGKCE